MHFFAVCFVSGFHDGFLPPLKVASLNFQDEDMFLPTVSRKLEQLKHSMLSLKNGN